MLTFENDAILFLTDARGQFIPRDFAETINRDYVTGVSDEDWLKLEAGPDHEWYWDTWIDVEQNARIYNPDTQLVYSVYQDGDCFLVPLNCTFPEY